MVKEFDHKSLNRSAVTWPLRCDVFTSECTHIILDEKKTPHHTNQSTFWRHSAEKIVVCPHQNAIISSWLRKMPHHTNQSTFWLHADSGVSTSECNYIILDEKKTPHHTNQSTFWLHADSGVSSRECNYIMLADKDATQHNERLCLASLCLADSGVSTSKCNHIILDEKKTPHHTNQSTFWRQLCRADNGVSTSKCNHIILAEKDATPYKSKHILAPRR